MLSAGRPVLRDRHRLEGAPGVGGVPLQDGLATSSRGLARRGRVAPAGHRRQGRSSAASAPAETTARRERRMRMCRPFRGRDGHLMPVMAMPCMIRRWSTRKTTSTGSTTTTEPASSSPYFVAFWPDGVEGQRDRQGELVLRRGDDQRPEEVVPRREERQHAEGGDRGAAERQHDREEDAQLAGAVDPRGLDQLVGHG